MNSARLINILTKEIPVFTNALMHMLIILTEIFVFIGISLLLLYFEPKGFLIVSLISFLVLWTYHLFTSKKLTILGRQRQECDSLVVQKIQQGLGGLREIKVYSRELGFYNTFKKSVFKLYKISWISDFIHKIPRLILEFASVLSLAAIVLLFINFNSNINDIIVILGLFALAAARILPSLSRIYNAYQRIKFGDAATALICEELQRFDEQKLSSKNSFERNNVEHKHKLEFNNSIKIENLTFKHNAESPIIFDKINLELKKGEIIGITGPSGSGKSTLADLILGLIYPLEGKILIDGRNINENLNAWQKKASYVPQNIFLTDDKLSRNIALGLEDNEILLEQLNESIRSVELNQFINSLPQNIDTIVGERGSRISGGQKQRIGLARALYNKPDLLILDETTNALDKNTEKKIIETIFKIRKNKTIIFISHDAGLLKNCDTIFSIENKKNF